MFGRTRIIAVLVASALFSFAGAQRLSFTVDLSEPDQENPPKFDVNSVPVSEGILEVSTSSRSGRTIDLNFSPTVLVSADSTQAFVNYAGSDIVLIFNPKTGAILDQIQVGKNPAQMSFTPDGKKVAVASVHLDRNLPKPGNFDGDRVGSISLIDVETHAVEMMEFQDVFFSMGNNMVFSGDGKTGYIASAATDEILRFDLETLTEITPRLGLTPGGRPISLTMAPDASFFTVVLVGSTNLSRTDVPDSVRIVDTESFSVVATLAPKTGANTEEPIIHDFTATTLVEISPDGKWGLIADQQISSVNVVPELAADRVWLIDFEERNFVDVFRAGGIASGIFWAPTDEFAVVATFDITLYDPVERTKRVLTPSRSNFRPKTRPAFLADSQLMVIAAPLQDTLIYYDLVTEAVVRFVSIGGLVERGSAKLPSAPLYVEFTPDQEVLLAVNFNANKIDLVRDTEQLYIPRAVSDNTFFTGIALTNVGTETAELVSTGLSVGGIPFTDDLQTDEVVEFENPRTFDLEPGRQIAQTSEEWVVSVSDEPSADGWFDFDFDRSSIKSFFLIGDRASKRLDGSVAVKTGSLRTVIPEVRLDDVGMLTQLVIANPNRSIAEAEMTLYDQAGEEVATFSRTVAPRGLFVAFVKDPNPDVAPDTGLFSLTDLEDFEEGYIVVESPVPVFAFERYYDDERMSALNGIPEEALNATRLFLAQSVSFQGNQTTLNLVNASEETIQATLTLFGNGGNHLGTAELPLEAGHELRSDVVEIFGLTDSGEVVSGWIEIATDKPGLVADAEMQLFSGRAMTTIPAVATLGTDLTFSHVAEGLGLATGLALVNPGDQAASTTVEVYDPDGMLKASTLLSVDPGERVSQQLNELFPELGTQLGGYVRVQSDTPILGLELFFRNDLELISAVIQQ